MPSKDTKIISIRVPNRIDFGDVNLHKLIVDIHDQMKSGAITIEDNKLIVPEEMDCDECPSRKVHEEVKEIAHDKGLTADSFFRMAKR